MAAIYKITCTANEKFYIGSTVDVVHRFGSHRRALRRGVHKNKNMQASWTKYGEACFVFEVIEEVADAAKLLAAEQVYLDEHAGREYCFNWALHAAAPMRGKSGADTPNFGRVVGPDTRQRISAAVSGANHPNWGKALSEETKEKIRAANLAHPHKDHRHTPEAREKIAAASRGRPVSAETRAKRSAALKGRTISIEQRQQISQTLSGEGNYWYGKTRPDHAAKVRKAVVAVDPSGVETRYESIQLLREQLGLTPTTVNRALKSGTALTRGPYRGWQFRYDVI